MNPMKVLIACEESQRVCLAFRARGHEAYSCDLQECSGGHPEWHIQQDAIDALYASKWDLVIAHPPCDRLANSGVRWLAERNLWRDLQAGIEFFREFQLYAEYGNRIAIENPIPHIYARDGFFIDKHDGSMLNGQNGITPWRVDGIGKYTQIIQPWQFGHSTTKATCLWLYGLPELKPTKVFNKDERTQDIWLASPGPDRKKLRSKTFEGIAAAMAEQWT